jgi:16S rRNA (guanine527-N7)-methyltransferase
MPVAKRHNVSRETMTMDEDAAKHWLTESLNVSRETLAQLAAFREMVIEESTRQNLISAASIPQFWVRHIVDSAQLLLEAPTNGAWLDLGTGAGFPGIVIAILRTQPITFVESRRRRIDFLAASAKTLGLDHVTIQGSPLERVESAPFSVISARAFAPLPKLLTLAHRFSQKETVWLLPKGQSAQEELESLAGSWHGDFSLKPSVTDAQSAIIIGRGVTPQKRTSKG